ncbi:PREDICTED: protein SPIRAL1-like 5 [Tarenaya hassleriana]|uniref:protein SPIRAL1-like 5 n=1 Tax=Tarenaya hassleriana TaxID=28532 RepID=UPI00053C6CBF|nr:PREDICTED: protein SPIRAL1-like 5 [Tarenaya hassleriana]
MSRGGSYGGGQSSLGYLFGSENDQPPQTPHPAAAKPTPPYGVDDGDDKPKIQIAISNNNYHRAHGQNSGNFVTDRPTTKVKSVPGGGSSLGYLFGDK